jgi:hypothetical protein
MQKPWRAAACVPPRARVVASFLFFVFGFSWIGLLTIGLLAIGRELGYPLIELH